MSALCRSISSGYKAKANLKHKPFEHALITTILARGGGGGGKVRVREFGRALEVGFGFSHIHPHHSVYCNFSGAHPFHDQALF